MFKFQLETFILLKEIAGGAGKCAQVLQRGQTSEGVPHLSKAVSYCSLLLLPITLFCDKYNITWPFMKGMRIYECAKRPRGLKFIQIWTLVYQVCGTLVKLISRTFLLQMRQTNFWVPKLTRQQNPILHNKLTPPPPPPPPLAHLTSGLTGWANKDRERKRGREWRRNLAAFPPTPNC